MKNTLTTLAAMSLMTGGCAEDRVLSNPPPERYSEADRSIPTDRDAAGTFIIDATGKRWDIAHAATYGLVPSGFQYGLGPFAIRPLNEPVMILPGAAAYPSSRDRTMVLGVELNGHVRAYPTWTAMSAFEVANERFGKDHVAVAF